MNIINPINAILRIIRTIRVNKPNRKTLPLIVAAVLLLAAAVFPVHAQTTLEDAALSQRIEYYPETPRVGQVVTFKSIDFSTQSIDWDFGDLETIAGGNRTSTHTYQTAGTYTVTAKDTPIDHEPAAVTIVVLEDNRFISFVPQLVTPGAEVTFTANHFRCSQLDWDFGDGTAHEDGEHAIVHVFDRGGGVFTVTARDACNEDSPPITVQVSVGGVSDVVRLEMAELVLDNGKNYKVVPKNSTDIRARLRLKLSGTGTVTGQWEVDGQVLELFEESVTQGELKEIITGDLPGLPTVETGLHTITLVLTEPDAGALGVEFPVLRYYVRAVEDSLKLREPPDGFVVKEDEATVFSWRGVTGAASYEVAFADAVLPLTSREDYDVVWHAAPAGELDYRPTAEVWRGLKRNRWSYWCVRALDEQGKVMGTSPVREIKIVIAAGKVRIKKVTDLEERDISILPGKRGPNRDGKRVKTTAEGILVHGEIDYKGDSQFMVLRVYVNRKLTDRLVFRDVKKNVPRSFETYIPNDAATGNVHFELLKTSSPAVIVGIDKLKIIRE